MNSAVRKVLRLNTSGMPTQWLSFEEAAVIYTKNLVIWELGDKSLLMRGGINGVGQRSILKMSPVIATVGLNALNRSCVHSFSNRMLFRRDNHRCLYCGYRFSYAQLTRDHVIPRAQGGRDTWSNLVAACKRCNHTKGNRTPEQANMPLLAIPFVPNPFESMFLAQHTVLEDQMAYLEKQFSGRRQWLAA